MLKGFSIKYFKSQSDKLAVNICFLHLQSTVLGVTLEYGAAAPKHVGKGTKHVPESFCMQRLMVESIAQERTKIDESAK